MSDSSRPLGLQQARLPCPSPTPGAYSNSSPSHRWCHPTISSSLALCRVCFAHLCRVQSISLALMLTSLLTSRTKTFWGWLLPPFPLVLYSTWSSHPPQVKLSLNTWKCNLPNSPSKGEIMCIVFLKKANTLRYTVPPKERSMKTDFELLLLSTQTTLSTPGYASALMTRRLTIHMVVYLHWTSDDGTC